MKDFRFGAASRGAKVCTRCGEKVEIVKMNFKHDEFPIIAKVNDRLEYFTRDGRYFSNAIESEHDLMLL